MTKTPQQIRNEVEKGCGNYLGMYRRGLDFEDDKCKEDDLCDVCEGKLSILTEYDKSIKEIIEDLENPYPEDIYPRIEPERFKDVNDTLKEIFGFPLDRLSAHLMRIARENVKRELLSKIGDNSNSENWDSGDTCVYEGDNSEVEK